MRNMYRLNTNSRPAYKNSAESVIFGVPACSYTRSKREVVLNNSSRRMRAEGLKVGEGDSSPDWATADRLPAVGEIVMCTGGRAEVIKLCGKTSDGSRLLELKLIDEKAAPFFAASSNVLLRV
jgi:hypothetical protein